MLSAVIVAAGRSTRAGFDKVFAQLGGRPVLQYSLEAFERSAWVDEIVVVCRATKTEAVRALVASAKITKARAFVAGGERRQDSVQAAFDAISPAAEFIAVHDAARPLVTPEEIERVVAAACEQRAAVLARPVNDTLKTSDHDRFVTGSIDRASVFAMETPQVFARQLLLEAYARVAREGLTVTDEVSAIQILGVKVAIVPAQKANLKLTVAGDLEIAECLLRHPERSLGDPDAGTLR